MVPPVDGVAPAAHGSVAEALQAEIATANGHQVTEPLKEEEDDDEVILLDSTSSRRLVQPTYSLPVSSAN